MAYYKLSCSFSGPFPKEVKEVICSLGKDNEQYIHSELMRLKNELEITG